MKLVKHLNFNANLYINLISNLHLIKIKIQIQIQIQKR